MREYVTRIVGPLKVEDRDNVVIVPSKGVLFERRGYGRILALIIQSSTNNYELAYWIDGEEIEKGSYSYFSQKASILSEIVTTGTVNGDYILKLKDLGFTKSIKVEIYTNSKLILKKVRVEYVLV